MGHDRSSHASPRQHYRPGTARHRGVSKVRNVKAHSSGRTKLLQKLDPDAVPQFGLIAEQVEKVNRDLVLRDTDGKVNAVRYEAVNAMLLNEFLKPHRKLQEQQTTIERQQKQIEALTAGLQKVTARVEAANPVPRVVSDN